MALLRYYLSKQANGLSVEMRHNTIEQVSKVIWKMIASQTHTHLCNCITFTVIRIYFTLAFIPHGGECTIHRMSSARAGNHCAMHLSGAYTGGTLERSWKGNKPPLKVPFP